MESKKDNKLTQHKSYTAWHIFLADVMDYLIDPDDLEVHPFEKLGSLPLETDFIIICRKEARDLKRLYPDFNFMIPYLGKYTIMEYKSPLDTLNFEDFDIARAYGLLAKRKYQIAYDRDIHIISMASHFQRGYRKYIEENRYNYREIEEGIYNHTDSQHNLYWIDLKIIGRKDPESFINLFCSNYKKYEASNKQIRIRHFEVLNYICQGIFKKELRMNNIEIRQLPEFTTSIEIMKKKFLESLKPEERLAGLKPEEIVTRLKLEDRLAGLKPEDRLAGLKPKDLKKLREILNG